MSAHWRYLKYVVRHKWFVLVVAALDRIGATPHGATGDEWQRQWDDLLEYRAAAELALEDAAAFAPPAWATDAFLRHMSTDTKMAARAVGADAWPRAWTMIDAVIWWWETQGRTQAGRRGLESRPARAGEASDANR